jgi:hypothetical protein
MSLLAGESRRETCMPLTVTSFLTTASRQGSYHLCVAQYSLDREAATSVLQHHLDRETATSVLQHHLDKEATTSVLPSTA